MKLRSSCLAMTPLVMIHAPANRSPLGQWTVNLREVKYGRALLGEVVGSYCSVPANSGGASSVNLQEGQRLRTFGVKGASPSFTGPILRMACAWLMDGSALSPQTPNPRQ